jgi:hypothetical protein
MTRTHVVTGTITDPRTITLDDALPTDAPRVRVWVEVLPTGPKPTMAEAIAEIRRRQKERGHVPMTTEQVEALFAEPPEPEDSE